MSVEANDSDGKAWTGKMLIGDYRCRNCGRLLFRAHIPNVQGFYIEVRCYNSRCGQMNVFRPAEPAPEQIRAVVEQNATSIVQNATSILTVAAITPNHAEVSCGS